MPSCKFTQFSIVSASILIVLVLDVIVERSVFEECGNFFQQAYFSWGQLYHSSPGFLLCLQNQYPAAVDFPRGSCSFLFFL